MNLRTVIFITTLVFIIGLVIGYSSFKPKVITECPPSSSAITIRDTIIKIKVDTIKIPVEKIRYFIKDTVIIKNNVIMSDTSTWIKCISFPLILSDSSVIDVTGCSKDNIPRNITFDATYSEKREKFRIIESTRVDTIKQRSKRLGFAIGPSAGIGIDINNLERPAYFVGVTLMYGWRF